MFIPPMSYIDDIIFRPLRIFNPNCEETGVFVIIGDWKYMFLVVENSTTHQRTVLYIGNSALLPNIQRIGTTYLWSFLGLDKDGEENMRVLLSTIDKDDVLSWWVRNDYTVFPDPDDFEIAEKIADMTIDAMLE